MTVMQAKGTTHDIQDNNRKDDGWENYQHLCIYAEIPITWMTAAPIFSIT